MQKLPFTDKDTERLKEEIQFSFKLGLKMALLLSAGAAAINLLYCLILFIRHKKVQTEPIHPIYIVIGFILFPFFSLLFDELLKYIDLKRALKRRIMFNAYEFVSKKRTTFIVSKNKPKQKIEIDEYLIPLIIKTQPLDIEITPLSKFILCIAQNGENLLDKIDYDTIIINPIDSNNQD